MDTSAPYTPRERALIEAAYRWALLAREEGFDASRYADAGVRDGLPPVPNPEASRLFERLASGKLPLAHAPPTRDELPWYDIIEDDRPQLLDIESLKPVDTDLLPSNPLGYLPIFGAYWTLKEIVDDDAEYVVTFGKFPMRWRVKRLAGQQWQLSREGLGAWVWQGAVDPNPFIGYPSQVYLPDENGPCWIVSAPEAAKPNRWAWMRVDFDAEERISRYVRLILPASVSDAETEYFLQDWNPLAGDAALDESVYVLDRNHLGRILRAFHVPRSATPWAKAEPGDQQDASVAG